MAATASKAVVGSHRGSARASEAEARATAAWLCAIPCGAIAALAIVVLGPPLGTILTPAQSSYRFLIGSYVTPEPTEHARYLLAVAAPLLGVATIALAPRWLTRMSPAAVGPTVVAAQLTVAGLVLAAIVAQYRLRYGAVYTLVPDDTMRIRYFTPATYAVAAVFVAGVTGALRSRRVRRWATVVPRDTPRRRRAMLGLAVVVTAVWMLHAVHTETEIGNALLEVRYHLGFLLDETFAVLNGRTPLVNFSAQYGALWPFVVAVPMLAFGKTVTTFTIVLSALSTIGLLAVYGVLRRTTRSSLAALLLYLPFLATSLYLINGTLANRATPGTYYGTFPMRYTMPYVLAWLTVRQLERGHDRARELWLLFTVAGLTLINNVEFGLPALGGTVAALVWATPEIIRTRAGLRVARGAALGLLTAWTLVALVTLIRAGQLPQMERLVDYAGVFGVGGWGLMPINGVLGMHLLVYLTYVAALLVASVRAARRARNRLLTAMLSWASVFGLGTGTYYVGRSHPESLPHLFSAWSLTLALLTVVAARELTVLRLRRTAIGAVIVLFGFGVTVCSLAQTPTPWQQLQRLTAPFVPTEEQPYRNPLEPPADANTRRFIASVADGPSRFVVRQGAPVAILVTTGHRIADAYRVVNVSPYTGKRSVPTVERVEAVLDALRDAGGNTVIMPDPYPLGIVRVLSRRGFELLTPTGLQRARSERHLPSAIERSLPSGDEIMKWVDTRHLHAGFLDR